MGDLAYDMSMTVSLIQRQFDGMDRNRSGGGCHPAWTVRPMEEESYPGSDPSSWRSAPRLKDVQDHPHRRVIDEVVRNHQVTAHRFYGNEIKTIGRRDGPESQGPHRPG